MKPPLTLARLLSVLVIAGDPAIAREKTDQRTLQIPNAEGSFVESGCGQPDADTCELRLLRNGTVIASTRIPLGSQLTADAAGEFVVAINSMGAVRVRTADMNVDRRVAYPRALVGPSSVVVGPGAARVFMLIGTSIVILNMDGEQLFGVMDIKKKRSRLIVALEAVGLAAAAAAVVVVKPDALLKALPRTGSPDRSKEIRLDTNLELTRDGKDVRITYRPNGRIVLLDAATGELLWDTQFRMR